MKKVYLFLADGFETIEGLTVVDILRRGGIEIRTVSMNETKTVTTAHHIQMEADQVFADSDYLDAAAIVLPGGIPGTPHLAAHKGLEKLIKDCMSKDVYIAAICAAPSVLGGYGVLNGKECTSYPGYEEQLVGGKVLDQAVVQDGLVITARGMGASIDFALKLLENLKSKDDADHVSESIQFKQYYRTIQ